MPLEDHFQHPRTAEMLPSARVCWGQLQSFSEVQPNVTPRTDTPDDKMCVWFGLSSARSCMILPINLGRCQVQSITGWVWSVSEKYTNCGLKRAVPPAWPWLQKHLLRLCRNIVDDVSSGLTNHSTPCCYFGWGGVLKGTARRCCFLSIKYDYNSEEMQGVGKCGVNFIDLWSFASRWSKKLGGRE